MRLGFFLPVWSQENSKSKNCMFFPSSVVHEMQETNPHGIDNFDSSPLLRLFSGSRIFLIMKHNSRCLLVVSLGLQRFSCMTDMKCPKKSQNTVFC